MPVPILLVTGYLGAGKTTLINRLLTEPQGRRLAAVVNDFGAIDIDAQLLASAADGVVSLRNGCICCSLQGDLLRTVATILRRAPPPDGIVIETSGVSDPAEIVRVLLDPVIWHQAALDAVICVADARHLADDPALSEDALFRSQLRAADFVALSKPDLVDPAELAQVRAGIARHKPARVVTEMRDGRIAPELLFSSGLHEPSLAGPGKRPFSTVGFETMSWTSPSPLSLERFQAAIGQLAGRVVRAKGFVTFTGQAAPTLFQLVGDRATIAAAPPGHPVGTSLVFIARDGALATDQLTSSLERCIIQ